MPAITNHFRLVFPASMKFNVSRLAKVLTVDDVRGRLVHSNVGSLRENIRRWDNLIGIAGSTKRSVFKIKFRIVGSFALFLLLVQLYLCRFLC